MILSISLKKMSDSFPIIVTIKNDFTWSLTIASYVITQYVIGSPKQLDRFSVIFNFLAHLDDPTFCLGNCDERFMAVKDAHQGTFKSKNGTVVAVYDERPFPNPTIRNSHCKLIIKKGNEDRCNECENYRFTLHSLTSKLKSKSNTSPSLFTNIRFLSSPEKKKRIIEYRMDKKALKMRLSRLQCKLENAIGANGVDIDKNLSNDLLITIEDQNISQPPSGSFVDIFRQTQIDMAKRSGNEKNGVRWHPLMIRWALYIKHLSSKAYETLRQSGCIHLPSQRTLRDYSHCIKAEPGFSTEVDIQLATAANLSNCPDADKLVILLIDEIHLKENLVYNKTSGEMVGFVNLGTVNSQLLAYENSLLNKDPSPQLANSMMSIMVWGIFSDLRFPYAHFPCSSITGEQLFHLFWKAVYRLERMGFKVLATTFDGASINRCLVALHDTSTKLIHKVLNIHAPDERYLYFFSDPPHLIKTTRNCWVSKARKLWKNGKCISWQHLTDLYERDRGKATGLAMLPKIKYEHLHLSSFSKMRVDLAAQVLSESVSKALTLTAGPEVEETAKFTMIFDKFFDLLNVRNFTKGTYSRKRFLHPYRHGEDHRLDWLKNEFLPYLDEWEQSVESRTDVTKADKKRMVLSVETMLGLRITALSFIEFIPFLFSLPEVKDNKMAFLSNRLCQDPIEKFFGCQRQVGGTNDNPSVQEFFKNTETLRVVNSFCRGPVRDNCRGGESSKEISSGDILPIPKRSRAKKVSGK